jgi:uncharacterized SAM-binding protein YcdF (DUF218 family)
MSLRANRKSTKTPFLLRAGYYSLWGFSGVWLIGFFFFIQTVFAPLTPQNVPTDLIVVLTGGQERIEEGLRLLSHGYGKRLLISGVHAQVSMEAILSQQTNTYDNVKQSIILGREAANTQGNALETALWVQKTEAHSIRLITANYHMPRSLVIFKRQLPHIQLIPHPVEPPTVSKRTWIAWPGTMGLLFWEYNKYLTSFVSLGL